MTRASDAILVVEDDRFIREALREVLESEGWSVTEAANGAEGLAQLRSPGVPPRVILLDLMMPVLDGPSFRTQQLEDPALRAIPVVVMSADSKGEEKRKTMAVQGYLRKPVDLEELLALLGRFRPE